MSYIVILMSFQTIYSINYGGSEHPRPLPDQNFEKFITPPPLQYIDNFQSPPFNARKYFGARPLDIINVLSLSASTLSYMAKNAEPAV
jgi:hypothetical protein